MLRRIMPLLFTLLLLPCGVAWADSGVPYVGAIDYGPTVAPTLLVVPAGTGAPFGAAREATGAVVDARVTVWLVDLNYVPIANFPREDVWLQFAVAPGTAAGCRHYTNFPGGVFSPDNNSDADGRMVFAQPAQGGGWSSGPVWVYLNGSPAYAPDMIAFAPLPLQSNSPDLNGDLTVNLADVPLFAADYYGEFHLRSDLFRDGETNLSDLVVLAENMGVACP